MNQVNPSIISHVSIGTNDFDKARAFYQQVLAALDIQTLMDFPGATAFGRMYPEFWVQTPIDGKPAAQGNVYRQQQRASACVLRCRHRCRCNLRWPTRPPTSL